MFLKITLSIVLLAVVGAYCTEEGERRLMNDMKSRFPKSWELNSFSVDEAIKLGQAINAANPQKPTEEEIVKGAYKMTANMHYETNELERIGRSYGSYRKQYLEKVEELCKFAIHQFAADKVRSALSQSRYGGAYEKMNLDDPKYKEEYGEEAVKLAKALKPAYYVGGREDVCLKVAKMSYGILGQRAWDDAKQDFKALFKSS